MKLFSPEADGTLGYVNHRYNPGSRFHRIGNFFIGTGPVWGGIFMLWLITLLFLPAEMLNFDHGAVDSFLKILGHIFSADFWCRWQSYLWLYLVLTVSSHITLSPPDLAGAKEGAITLIATVFLLELFFGWSKSMNTYIDNFLHNGFVYVSGVLGAFLLITLLFSIILKLFIKKQR